VHFSVNGLEDVVEKLSGPHTRLHASFAYKQILTYLLFCLV
jgi:hypothetical protein